MKLKIATGSSRHDLAWKNVELTWEELCARLSRTKRTPETVEEYRKLPKIRQDAIKDVGGFVGGHLAGGRRKRANVTLRSVLTLDLDFAPAGFWDEFTLLYDWRACLYSTHKHTPDAPRYRLVIPLGRDTSPEEYVALGRRIAQMIGIEYVDDTTYEAARLMYWASTSADGEFVFERQDGPLLDVDATLATYDDWRDVASWPTSSREQQVPVTHGAKQADPTAKAGLVGAFCRSYSVPGAIEAFLPGVYVPTAQDDRWTFAAGESASGLVIYDDGLFAFSHHATDPAGGQLVNAFDLVRLHRFSHLDADAKPDTPTNRLPSYLAMADLARDDEPVKRLLADERRAEVTEEFQPLPDSVDIDLSWTSGLELDRKGRVADNLRNLELILERDQRLGGIVYNQMSDALEITAPVPWKHQGRIWRDADDAQLQSYLNQAYARFSERDYKTALTKVADDRSYHPVRDYLNALPAWDGTERADTLLVDYLGAPNDAYVRAVTRKTLCAAVCRVLRPGAKFDHMLVLSGPQGIGKSTLIERLAGEWFSDSLNLSDTKDKTAAEKLQGYWILEIGELAGMRKAEVETLRSFITRTDDIYRAAFGKRVTPHPRQCVFFATTNAENGYLRDETGNRRFWPVEVNGISTRKPWHLDEATRSQVWAEVLVRVKAGETLYLDHELALEASKRQRGALESDEREGIIADYLAAPLPPNWDAMTLYERRNYLRGTEFGEPERTGGVARETVCTLEIWCECFGRNQSELTRAESLTIVRILQKLGWQRSPRRHRIPLYGAQWVHENSEFQRFQRLSLEQESRFQDNLWNRSGTENGTKHNA